MEKIKPLKIEKIVYIVNSELGGTDIIKCKVIKSHYGDTEEETESPYPDEDYDVQEIETGIIWDFLCR